MHLIVDKKFPYASSVTTKSSKAPDAKKDKSQFFNLMLHRKVCNHPQLVYNQPELKQEKSNDKDAFINLPKAQQTSYLQSGKLIGLVEVLQQCEILKTTVQSETNEDTKATGSLSGADQILITDVPEGVSKDSIS